MTRRMTCLCLIYEAEFLEFTFFPHNFLVHGDVRYYMGEDHGLVP